MKKLLLLSALVVVIQSNVNATNLETQKSGGLHGYTVDMSAVNSRNLVGIMRDRALIGELDRPEGAYTQDFIFLNNEYRLKGLLDGKYDEYGGVGITERQISKKGRLGLIYGGSKGKANFGGDGSIRSDIAYVGGYYSHKFNDKFSLNSNFTFSYGHNSIDRQVEANNFYSHYPTFGFGLGTVGIYTLMEDESNSLKVWAGIDTNRIIQGNINENEEVKTSTGAIKNIPVNEQDYYSVTPSIGIRGEHKGYIFDKKYKLGTEVAHETEVGNIKDGKIIDAKKRNKIKSLERENVISGSIYGELEMTKSLNLNARYTMVSGNDFNANIMTVGLNYKLDDFKLQASERRKFERWGGTFAFMFENEDDSDRVYYVGDNATSGDYQTSMKMKPKFTLSLNDKKTKWSYYFEGYYFANDFLKDTKANEREFEATRIHGEARWTDKWSKGTYGMYFGYRNETSDKPVNAFKKDEKRTIRGVHQLRLTPMFTYDLGNKFMWSFKPTTIFEYNYTGDRDGQMDIIIENEQTLIYSGFMPRWNLKLGFYREDRWLDNDNSSKSIRYQLTQLRPGATYYFGNGDNFDFSMRIPLGNGNWTNNGEGIKGTETYETRYTVKYTHVVRPGVNVFGGINILNIKVKAVNGTESRSYSFRPSLGFSYSF